MSFRNTVFVRMGRVLCVPSVWSSQRLIQKKAAPGGAARQWRCRFSLRALAAQPEEAEPDECAAEQEEATRLWGGARICDRAARSVHDKEELFHPVRVV